MRRFVFAAMFVMCATGAAFAQNDAPLSPLALKVACGPPATLDAGPANALRVIGAQDTMPRRLFGNRDLLVIGGGTSTGVQLGQEFFLRRDITFGGYQNVRGAKTLGWSKVVAVNESTAIALVEFACGGIIVGDYLQPFVAPEVSAEIEKDETPGQPDFASLGHIVVGNEGRESVGPGDLALIDWGQDKGLQAGARFAIYRGMGVDGLPLASVGEGIVISTGSGMALTRITRARDAVFSGDYVALRK
jgi:hypothetical protein